ncbi:DNA gyrase subunit A [Pseudoduganella albidiflava]|uniref:DNA gyrase subunit A n=1 Tax=Pseudoduganella albidiflava TaxID=321983 RepID=A0A411X2C6_9BURK|nr:DNA gyrase subunit A [Pseudoduganella albidiflava]QBI03104.1 DNA gyrase subunit A [Pseudoduganella albidiflava]GGY59024.1 DNA gyrase subunit A [Pseudoduganella albidiflava]
MDQFAKETIPISLEEEMRKSYLDYAMSVIVGRALPDARDGLKPVHRRVLFSMHESNYHYNRPYVKCARVVGDTMGKYHPHGDASIYDTLVRMAQDFSLRYTLVDGQGNFGSIDGDAAAAMRYTECRLDKIAGELLADIDKETVDFQPNYDGKEKEPTVLPTRVPNLLINGSSGIAVGMATNIPPHNLAEVISGALHVLANPDCTVDELIELIPAPDFPTGGTIYGVSGVRDGYRTGRGRVVMRAKTHFEEYGKDGGRMAIIVDELPYQVNKKSLLERIAENVRDKKLEGISDIRDESDKSGMRVVIELKRGEVPEVVLNNLYKQTQLQDTFGMNMVALVDNQPKLMNLKDLLSVFLSHRREVVTRRTVFELRKARERGHVLEGLAVALANIDDFIAIIKAAPTPPLAKTELMARAWDSSLVREMLARTGDGGIVDINAFRPEHLPKHYGMQADGLYKLSDDQAQEILQMRLQRLTGLEQDKIVNEYKDVMAQIADLLDILAKPARVTAIISDELTAAVTEYGAKDVRRSTIEHNATDLETEDLITPQDMVVTLSHMGYMKAQPISEYRAQKRGGRGKQAMATKDEDWIDQLFIANTHDYILCFSNRGRMYWLKVWEVPQGSRNSRGKPIVNMFPLQDNEKITVVLPLSGENRTFPEDHYVFMSTSLGTVKKTPLKDFSNPRKAGIIAVDLDEGDFLIGAALTDGKHDVMLFSDAGKAVRFDENDVRPMGRTARGVRGMNLDEGQNVIALLVAENEQQTVLTATENGYGKRTPITEYTRHGRGTKGMIAIQTTERNGKVVAATLVDPSDEIMLITTGGVLIRTRVSEIREMGRATQGVTLIAVEDGTHLSGLQRIVEADADEVDALAEAAAGAVADSAPEAAAGDSPAGDSPAADSSDADPSAE